MTRTAGRREPASQRLRRGLPPGHHRHPRPRWLVDLHAYCQPSTPISRTRTRRRAHRQGGRKDGRTQRDGSTTRTPRRRRSTAAPTASAADHQCPSQQRRRPAAARIHPASTLCSTRSSSTSSSTATESEPLRAPSAYDEGFPDPKTIGDEGRDAYCTMFPEQCGAFCTSNETFNTLADAYCKANKKSPICEPAARSRRAMWRVYAGRFGATLVNE